MQPIAWTRRQDERRAVRWLRSTGGLAWVSPEAWELLVDRLRVRWHASNVAALAALVVIAGSVAVAVTQPGSHLTPMGSPLGLGVWAFITTSIVMGSIWLVEMRGDRAIASRTANRIARAQRPRVAEVLGFWRWWIAAAAFVVDAVVVGTAWDRGPALRAAELTALLCLGWAATTVLVRVALHRPTIAVDDCSLAIDERLRASEARRPLGIVYIATLAAQPVVPRAAVLPFAAAFVLGAALLQVALLPRRWRRPDQPRRGIAQVMHR